MNKEYHYYKVTGGAIKAAYDRWIAKSEKNRLDRKALCEEFGATHCYANNVQVVGLVFENTHINPPPKRWKPISSCPSAYKPSGGSAEMKKIRKRLNEDYPQADALDFQTEVIGMRNPFQFMDSNNCRFMLFQNVGGVLILLVPKVPAGDSKGVWNPPDAECVPLKTSELWQLKESVGA